MIIQTRQMLILLLLVAFPAGVRSSSRLDDGIQLYERGEYKRATETFMLLRVQQPRDPDVRLWTGKSFLKEHEWENAIKEMEESVKIRPSYAHGYIWLGRAIGERASHISFVRAFGLARKVVKAFETARKLAPNDLEARFDLLEYYLNAPEIVGGGEEKAKAEADAIAKIDAKMGYSARAAIYVKEKNWDLAKKEHLKAIAEYPQDADVHKDLAAFLLDREDYRGALEHIRKALALNGQSKQAKLIEAAANIQLAADLDNAARTLTELASNRLNDADPSFDEVYYWLGECHAAKGDKSKAIEAFTSALSFNPWHEKAKKRISKLK